MEQHDKYDLLEAFAKDYKSLTLAEDVILYEQAQGRVFRGQVVVNAVFEAFFVRGFIDVHVPNHTIIVDQENAVLEFTFCGRHHGQFMGIAPTEREINLPMVMICHIKFAQLQSASLYYDAGTLLRQIGLV